MNETATTAILLGQDAPLERTAFAPLTLLINLDTIYIHFEACSNCQEVLAQSGGRAADRIYRYITDEELTGHNVHRCVYYGYELHTYNYQEGYDAEKGY